MFVKAFFILNIINMPTSETLQRFIDAQKRDYSIALNEIKNGRKQSHWMWYIFPQIQGLGFSSASKQYAIKNIDEAAAYLKHEVLGSRLVEISNALLQLDSNNAHKIFGSPDNMKLKSSMTLFAAVQNANIVFKSVLNKFFNGLTDDKTIAILAS